MKTKNISKVLALSVLGLLTLTACDDTITAKPSQYNEELITTSTFDEDIYNNIASVVYDSIESEGIGSDVLNEILYLYGVSTFGPLTSKVIVNNKEVGESEITLEQAATNSDKIDAFVLAHKAYWDDPSASEHEGGASATNSEKARVIAKYNTIQDRIAEEMYSKISSGSYSDRHYFYEDRFLRSLFSSMESVSKPSTASYKPAAPILPDFEPEQVFDIYLTRDNYDNENRYIIDKVVPGIYRQLLTEQYLIDETYNTLGRAYARQVNIIKFTTNDNFPNTGFFLASKLVEEINAKPADYSTGVIASYEADPDIEDGMLQRFKDYSKAQIGVVGLGTAALAILEDARFDEGVIEVSDPLLEDPLEHDLGRFFDGTDYGELAYKYIQMRDFGGNGINSDLENNFTNNGAYSYEVGLEQQKLELQEKDYTTNGWFIKNGGLTDLPEAIRSRLFNIGVATGFLDKETEKTATENNRQYNGTSEEWEEAANENAYVCRINGHYFLKKASRSRGESINNDILHYDESSKSYYIVEIKQAASSSKLAKNGDRNYAKLVDDTLMQDIINEVTKVVGKGETYTTLATKKYLKALNIQYHDQSVYDYFKSNYPELFGEEASSEDTSTAE